MPFTLPALPYEASALEPVIDTTTMQIHHGKHHNAYITNLNNALAGKGLDGKSAEDLIRGLSSVPEDIRATVRNNGGGHVNHSMFWQIMAPKGSGGEPSGALADAIASSFGTLADMKTKVNDAGAKRFGSGWAWVVVKDGKLAVGSTANQDNPIMGEGVLALLRRHHRQTDPRRRRLGTRILPQVSEPPARLSRGLVGRGQLDESL